MTSVDNLLGGCNHVCPWHPFPLSCVPAEATTPRVPADLPLTSRSQSSASAKENASVTSSAFAAATCQSARTYHSTPSATPSLPPLGALPSSCSSLGPQASPDNPLVAAELPPTNQSSTSPKENYFVTTTSSGAALYYSAPSASPSLPSLGAFSSSVRTPIFPPSIAPTHLDPAVPHSDLARELKAPEDPLCCTAASAATFGTNLFSRSPPSLPRNPVSQSLILESPGFALDSSNRESVEHWQRKTEALLLENEQLRQQIRSSVILRSGLVPKEGGNNIVNVDGGMMTSLESSRSKADEDVMRHDEEFHSCSWRELAEDLQAQLELCEAREASHGWDCLDASAVLERTRRIELLLQMVFKDIPIIISLCDKDLRYTYVKFVCMSPSEVHPENIKGMKDTELVGVIPGALEMMKIKQEVLQSRVAQQREFTIPMDDGSTKWLVVTCEPICSKAGHILGVTTASMDVTEQAIARERLAQMREEMAVREATEKELRRAITAADEAMEAKNNFLAVMSHEIRTPLNGVLGMAQILATTPLDVEQKELVDAMVFSGDVLLAIISDILDLSKVEAGTMELEESEFNPRYVVKHVVRTAIAATRERGISIQAYIADDVPSVVIGDPLRLKQVITNLVFNAVKFTKRGYVKVGVRTLKPHIPRLKTQLSVGSTSSSSEVVGMDPDFGEAEKPASSFVYTRAGGVQRRECSQEAGLPNEWDPLLEGGRRDIPELVTVEGDARGFCQDGAVRQDHTGVANIRNTIIKVHSAGDLILDSLRRVHGQEVEEAGVEVEPSSDIWLEYEIEDTGIGIPREAFPTLFEKFTQVHSSTTRKYGGTGLGLAICKQLVELMGGQISVSSNVGKGSIFTFSVRCKRPSPPIGVAIIKSVSETRLKGNLSHSTARVRKLQAGMPSPSPTFKKCINFQSSDVVVTTSQKKLPRGSLKLRNCNDAEGICPMGWEECTLNMKGGSTWAPWCPWDSKENKDGDGALTWRGRAVSALRRTRSGPPRIECSLMADLEDTKLLPIIYSSAPIGEKKTPLLLLAEDNKVNVMVALSMLKRLGFAADVAYNGLEAVKALQTKHYDLVLMDICMPVMDGLEVTKLIRKFERFGYWDKDIIQATSPDSGSNRHRHSYSEITSSELATGKGLPNAQFVWGRRQKRLPIVAMTANALSDCEDQCSATGMDGFMTKPVTFKKLKDVLDLFLSEKSSSVI